MTSTIHHKETELDIALTLRGVYLMLAQHFSAILEHWWLRNIDDARLRARQQVIFQHLWSAELAIVGVLFIIMIFLSVQFVRLRKSDILQ